FGRAWRRIYPNLGVSELAVALLVAINTYGDSRTCISGISIHRKITREYGTHARLFTRPPLLAVWLLGYVSYKHVYTHTQSSWPYRLDAAKGVGSCHPTSNS
ncbi:hypothetical protein ACQKWADRAFT_292104, partial [Trichoderma austrokoningii]